MTTIINSYTIHERGSNYTAPSPCITIRGYTYTRPVHYHQKIHLHNAYRGSSYTAPSKYTTVRICAYTIPKGEQLQSAETIH